MVSNQGTDNILAAATTTTTTTPTYDSNQIVKVLGVCGGIGSGKSTVCQLLVSEFGCLAHIDADKVAHRVYSPGSEGVHAIVEQFGTGVLVQNNVDDGKDNENENNNNPKVPHEIHRPSLGAIVFTNPDAMKQLEQIVWPRTRELIQQQIQDIVASYQEQQQSTFENDVAERQEQQQRQQQEQRPIIIVEAAMLLDANWHNEVVHGTLVVTVSETTAIERLVQSRGLSYNDAMTRYNAQRKRRGVDRTNVQYDLDNNIITAIVDNNTTSYDELKQRLVTLLDDPTKLWYNNKS